MKDAAWKAMLANYPEAKQVKLGDVDGFLAALGLKRYKGEVVVNDSRFIDNGNGPVTDTKTGLMWARRDNGENINWAEAKAYCENYRGGGYTNWRMPTENELAGLYDKSKSRPVACTSYYNIHVTTELIDMNCYWYWASEENSPNAAGFNFDNGVRTWQHQAIYSNFRALPVRSAK